MLPSPFWRVSSRQQQQRSHTSMQMYRTNRKFFNRDSFEDDIDPNNPALKREMLK